MRGLMAFVRRHLSPADRLAETLCGLIMVLTFTLIAAPQVRESRAGVHDLLLATIGCNLAWGVIDGALYVLTAMSERARRAGLGRAVRRASSEAEALAVLKDALDDRLPAAAAGDDLEGFYRAMVPLARKTGEGPNRVTPDDLLGGTAILVVEVLCIIPAAIPFMVMSDRQVSLRVSNALLLTLLFVVGHRWGREIDANRLACGAAMLLLGALLVGVAMLLGG